MKQKYAISESDLVKMIEDLEVVVVSLDRIGSSSENLETVRLRTADFLGSPTNFRRFAKMRRVLSHIFDSNASPQAVKKLEAKLARLQYWRHVDRR